MEGSGSCLLTSPFDDLVRSVVWGKTGKAKIFFAWMQILDMLHIADAPKDGKVNPETCLGSTQNFVITYM